jgi:hypothetical protein
MPDLSGLSNDQLQAIIKGGKPVPTDQVHTIKINPGVTGAMPEGDFGKELLNTAGGAVMGGIQGAPLGPMGMIGGAGLGAVMAPQTKSDWATEALGTVMPWGKMEKAIAPMGQLAKFGIRSGAALGQDWVMDKLRGLLGQPDSRDWSGARVAAATVPGVLGNIGDRALQSGGTQVLQNKAAGLQGGIDSGAQALGAPGPVGDNLQQTNPLQGLRPTYADVQGDYLKRSAQMKASNIALQQAKKELQKLNTQRDQLLTSTEYSQPGDSTFKQALLAKNDADRDKFLKLTGVSNDIDRSEGTVRLGLIQEAQDNLDLVKQGINPYNRTQKLNGGDQQALTNYFQDAIDDHKLQIWSGKEQDVRQAGEQAQQNNDLYNTTNVGVQRLQKTVDGLQDEIKNNPFENVNLRTLVANNSGQPFNTQQFVSNLEGASRENIDALYKYLGQQKNGTQQIQTVRDSMMASMFSQAYDPKTKQLTNLPKLTQAGGPYNLDKIEALYGGGQQGTDAGHSLTQLINDVRSLGEVQSKLQALPTKDNTKAMVQSVLRGVIPSGILWATGHHGAAAAAELGIAAWPKLVDGVISQPQLGSAFHDFASKGGTAAALKANPMLENWLSKNSSMK